MTDKDDKNIEAIEALIKYGYSRNEINKMFGFNFLPTEDVIIDSKEDIFAEMRKELMNLKFAVDCLIKTFDETMKALNMAYELKKEGK